MLKVSLQSSDEEDIKLFFQLLSKKIATNQTDFTSASGEHHFLFELNFKELQKVVTKKSKNVTDKEKAKKDLESRVVRYHKSGLSFQKVANKLNDEGFRNSRNNKFNRQQIFRIIKNN